jgi:glycosyltransferase involved in cell wall biosynthesis
LLPVYNVEEKWLRQCIESVIGQLYGNWELCIADDCSPSPHIKRVLEEYAALDERIKIVFRPENGHISAASNSALELATGEFAALLDHDDELSEDALFYVVKEINEFPATDFIYSDEDMIDENGERYTPKFKPDFSRDFLYSVNYVTHLAVYRTSVLQKIGGFRIGLEGSQDYDLALRFIEQIPENHIRHIPRILYHWRAIQGSIALSGDEKPYAHERARTAIRQHLKRIGKQVMVEETVFNLHRVRYELPAKLPKVSLIFAADENLKFTEKAVENFIGQTDYANFEIAVIVKAETQFSKNESFSIPSNVKFIVCESNNEAEKLNFVVAQTDGEILCFADANLKPLAKDWLRELAGFAWQAEIGTVGAKILDPYESVLHGGLIFDDEKKIVAAAHRGHSRESGDNIGRLQLINNFSAVSVSCLVTRRGNFQIVWRF